MMFRSRFGHRSVLFRSLSTKATGSKRPLNNVNDYTVVSLPKRTVIALRGTDVETFLQGLTTNSVTRETLASGSLFTAFLTPKGKTMTEAILSYSNSSAIQSINNPSLPRTILIDISKEHSELLVKHLKKYKLRAKVEIMPLDDQYTVSAVMPSNPFRIKPTDPLNDEVVFQSLEKGLVNYDFDSISVDPRNPRLGFRLLHPKDLNFNSLQLPFGSNKDYETSRILAGLPEGDEVTDLFPLEWNLPYINGVSFHKGCYLGQELTARTNFRGVVKKRVMPVYFTSSGTPARAPSHSDPLAASLVIQSSSTVALHHVRTVASQTAASMKPPEAKTKRRTASTAEFLEQLKNSPTSKFHKNRVKIPFPFVDRHWRGIVTPGTEIRPLPGPNGEIVTERAAGKILGFESGHNLAMALIRVDPLTSAFLNSDAKDTAYSQAFTIGAGRDPVVVDDDGNTTKVPCPPGYVRQQLIVPGTPYDYEDPVVYDEILQFHSRSRNAFTNFALHDPEKENHDFKVVPIFPSFMRHIKNRE